MSTPPTEADSLSESVTGKSNGLSLRYIVTKDEHLAPLLQSTSLCISLIFDPDPVTTAHNLKIVVVLNVTKIVPSPLLPTQ